MSPCNTDSSCTTDRCSPLHDGQMQPFARRTRQGYMERRRSWLKLVPMRAGRARSGCEILDQAAQANPFPSCGPLAARTRRPQFARRPSWACRYRACRCLARACRCRACLCRACPVSVGLSLRASPGGISLRQPSAGTRDSESTPTRVLAARARGATHCI